MALTDTMKANSAGRPGGWKNEQGHQDDGHAWTPECEVCPPCSLERAGSRRMKPNLSDEKHYLHRTEHTWIPGLCADDPICEPVERQPRRMKPGKGRGHTNEHEEVHDQGNLCSNQPPCEPLESGQNKTGFLVVYSDPEFHNLPNAYSFPQLQDAREFLKKRLDIADGRIFEWPSMTEVTAPEMEYLIEWEHTDGPHTFYIPVKLKQAQRYVTASDKYDSFVFAVHRREVGTVQWFPLEQYEIDALKTGS